jgi:hypothetical protein
MTLTARENFAARRTKFADIRPKASHDALLVRYVSLAKAVNIRCTGFLLLLGPAILTLAGSRDTDRLAVLLRAELEKVWPGPALAHSLAQDFVKMT